MSVFSRFLLQAALGLLLLNIVIYFCRTVFASHQDDVPRMIKPFEVCGGSEDSAKRGIALAYLLSGHLSEIGKQMKASDEALKEAREASKDPKVVMSVDRESLVKPIGLPDAVFKPLNLSVSVANVEVGKLLSWLHNWLAEDDSLSLSVTYIGKKAVTTGAMKGAPNGAIWLESTGEDDLQLISDLALYIAQKPFAREHPAVEELKPRQFGALLDSLQRVAKLSRNAPRGDVSRADYLVEFERIEPLTQIKELSNWPPLMHLAADLAERAEQLEKSLNFYKKELDLWAGTGAASLGTLQSKIAQLEERLAASATTPVAVSASLPTDAAAQKLLALIGATDPMPENARVPVVGIVGSPPPTDLLPPGLKWTVAGKETGGGDGKDPHLDSYLAALIRSTQCVTPNARFVFGRLTATTSGGGLMNSSIVEAVNALIKSDEDVRVILIPYGPLGGEVFKRLFSELAKRGIVAILPAGNDPGTPPPFAGTPLTKEIVVSAAVDLDGKPAEFSSRSDEVLWAPGEGIAISSGRGARVEKGTGFSAAIAAGVVARLMSDVPGRKPAEVISALRETAVRQADQRIAVINLKAAAAKLALPPANPTVRQ